MSAEKEYLILYVESGRSPHLAPIRCGYSGRQRNGPLYCAGHTTEVLFEADLLRPRTSFEQPRVWQKLGTAPATQALSRVKGISWVAVSLAATQPTGNGIGVF